MSVFEERGKPEYPEKKPLGAREKKNQLQNSTHIWRRRRDLNTGNIGGRRMLSPLYHPCSPNNVMMIFNDNVAFYCYSHLSCNAKQSFLPQSQFGVIFVKTAQRRNEGLFLRSGEGGGGGVECLTLCKADFSLSDTLWRSHAVCVLWWIDCIHTYLIQQQALLLFERTLFYFLQ